MDTIFFTFEGSPLLEPDILYPQHLLVVDDDARLRDLLSKYLQEHGFVLSVARDVQGALDLLKEISFDLIVLDVMMPGQSGFDLCEKLRLSHTTTPILFLSAKVEVDDRLLGFEKGGDDYLPKPFEPKELLLRIKALLRRTSQGFLPSLKPNNVIEFGTFSFDLHSGYLTNLNHPIPLTEVERKILIILTKTPYVFHTRDNLAEKVSLGASSRSIDVQIVRLRRKIEEDPKLPRYLQTIRHKGYVFVP